MSAGDPTSPFQAGFRPGGRWRPGRAAARLACGLFALVGALPLVLAVLVRTDLAREWAATETTRLLREELGVEATFQVRVQLWPLAVAVTQLEVPANDGGSPVLRAESVTISPRLFSLLAGHLDAGEIEVESPRVRAVVRDGELVNLSYRLPESSGSSRRSRSRRAPLTSLAISDAQLDLDLDGIRVTTGLLDVDLYAEDGPAFELALRASETRVVRRRAIPGADSAAALAVDEDVVCQLQLRARYEAGELLVRRLGALGAADHSPAADSAASCSQQELAENPWQVALRLSGVRARDIQTEKPWIDGHVFARAPLGLVSRFADVRLDGWAGLSGDVAYDGQHVLPEFRGKLRAGEVKLDKYRLAKHLEASVELRDDRVLAPRVDVGWSDGLFDMREVSAEPLAEPPTLKVARIDVSAVKFPGLMRDLGVTPNTICQWDIDRIAVTNVRGTLDPLRIDGDMNGETRNFALFDRAWHAPGRTPMLAVPGTAYLNLRFGVRPNAFEFYDARIKVGSSKLQVPLVSLGFDSQFGLEVARSQIDLGELGSVAGVPWSGLAELSAEMSGRFSNPVLTGQLAVDDFHFGGFAIADRLKARTRFEPLKLELLDVEAEKGESTLHSPSTRIAFDEGSSVLVDSEVSSPNLDLRDFLAIWNLDRDPRFDPLHGRGSVHARVHFDYGGPADRCNSGLLEVSGAGLFDQLDLFDEAYDSGSAQFRLLWDDREAGTDGMQLSLPSVTLTKGRGTLLASAEVTHGGQLRGHAVVSGIPASELRALGMLRDLVDARVSATAELGGRLDAPAFDALIHLTPVSIGSSTLPASRLRVALVPTPPPPKVVGRTHCGRPIGAEFDRSEWERDVAAGHYLLDGELFGGQVVLSGLEVSAQRAKRAKGKISLRHLDLGALAELSPAVALSSERPRGKISADLELLDVALDDPASSSMTVRLSELDLSYAQSSLELMEPTKPINYREGTLDVPRITLASGVRGGDKAVFDVSGRVARLEGDPELDLSLDVRPIDLSELSLPGVEYARGRLEGQLRVRGTASRPVYAGGVSLKDGELFVPRLGTTLSQVDLTLDIDADELRIRRGFARVGGGTLQLSGSAKLDQLEVVDARAVVTAKNLSIPATDGVDGTLDANLIATWKPSKLEGERSLPRITGSISLDSLRYTRPVGMTADISSLAERGQRTEFESGYDPAADLVELDITIRARRPLVLSNNLLEAELKIAEPGLVLGGTNQRYGLRGNIDLIEGGRIRLRQNEFEIRQGYVRFDDLTRIEPQVDVTAVTEYRRFANSFSSSASATTASAASDTAASSAGTGGRWLITLHAYGNAEALEIDLSANPDLSQDDIFLLLTIGLTRAELDQAQQASVGGSVALEALGTLTGADRAVTKAIPVIDDFRFGTAYSSRTGQTEPTITIGKRLADRIRASVTSAVSDSNQLRSNVEWRLNRQVSVEGSYDNQNDLATSSLGNLGADIRWRLEFE